jgi:hypothetical protein
MAPVEVTAADFTVWVEEGAYAHQVIDLPDGLPFDAARCALCDEAIGAYLDEDSDGRAVGGWVPAFGLPDGRFICEDCATYEPDYEDMVARRQDPEPPPGWEP